MNPFVSFKRQHRASTTAKLVQVVPDDTSQTHSEYNGHTGLTAGRRRRRAAMILRREADTELDRLSSNIDSGRLVGASSVVPNAACYTVVPA